VVVCDDAVTSAATTVTATTITAATVTATTVTATTVTATTITAASITTKSATSIATKSATGIATTSAINIAHAMPAPTNVNASVASIFISHATPTSAAIAARWTYAMPARDATASTSAIPAFATIICIASVHSVGPATSTSVANAAHCTSSSASTDGPIQ